MIMLKLESSFFHKAKIPLYPFSMCYCISPYNIASLFISHSTALNGSTLLKLIWPETTWCLLCNIFSLDMNTTVHRWIRNGDEWQATIIFWFCVSITDFMLQVTLYPRNFSWGIFSVTFRDIKLSCYSMQLNVRYKI